MSFSETLSFIERQTIDRKPRYFNAFLALLKRPATA
jgi:hypothetical protein